MRLNSFTLFRFKDNYVNAVNGIFEKLVKHAKPDGLVFVGEILNGWTFSPKMVWHLLLYTHPP